MANSILAHSNVDGKISLSQTKVGHRLINYVTAILVLLLAVGAFVLSYAALWDTALTYGIPARLAWIWPLLIDFALIVFSLAVVRASLYGERTLWPWFLVGLYTVATIAFNVIHAPADIIAQVIAVVAPVSLFLSFETLMGMLKSEVNRSQAVQSLSELTQATAHQRTTFEQQQQQQAAALSSLEEKIAAQQQRLQELTTEIEQTEQQGKPFILGDPDARELANKARTKAADERREQVRELLGQGLTNAELAEAVEVSEATIRRDLKKIRQEDILELLQEGHDKHSIAEELDLSLKHVERSIKQLNGRAEAVSS